MSNTELEEESPFASMDDRTIQRLAQEGKIDDALQLMDQIFLETEMSVVQLKTFHSVIKACSRSNQRNAGFQANKVLQSMERFQTDNRLDRDPHVGTYTMAMNAWVKSRHRDAGKEAEDILHSIAERAKERPSVVSYTIAINAWAKQGEVNQAESVFQEMLQDYNSGNPTARPGVLCFTTMMEAWARSGAPDAGAKCDRMLDYMDDMCKSGDLLERPNVVSYTTAIHAWAKVGDAKRAEAVFKRMVIGFKSGNESAKPTVKSFNALMDTWLRSRIPDAGEKCEQLLDQMESMEDPGARPNFASYTFSINAWAKQGNAHKAEQVFLRMTKDFKKGNWRAAPKVWTFNSLMSAWARSRSAEAGENCESLLNQMESMHQSGDLDGRPDTISYSTVINAWAKLGNSKRAEAVFERMVRDYSNGNSNARPNVQTMNTLMGAWARSEDRDAGEKCEALLNQMVEMYNSGSLDGRSDGITYSTAISTWAKLGNAEKAEAVFKRMVHDYYKSGNANAKPTVQAINRLIDAWAASGKEVAGQKCESLLDQMDVMYKSGGLSGRPDEFSYATTIHTLAKLGNAEKSEAVLRRMIDDYKNGNPRAKPNVQIITNVMDAVARSGSSDAGEICEEWLDLMEVMHQSGDFELRPNTISYAVAINAWAKLRDAKRAEAVFERMIRAFKKGNTDAKPNITTMNTLMDAWARSGSLDAGLKCEKYLDQMENMQQSGEVNGRPDRISYSIVINAWAKIGNPKRAEMIMERMNSDFEKGNKRAKPDVVCFASLVDAWAKSGSPDAGSNADEVLHRLEEWNMEPNVVILTSLLQCWEQSVENALTSKRVGEIQKAIKALQTTQT